MCGFRKVSAPLQGHKPGSSRHGQGDSPCQYGEKSDVEISSKKYIYIYRSYRSYIHQFYFILFHDIYMYLYIFMIVYVHIVLTLSGSTR